MVNVRYIVDDVDAAVEFYENRLGFEVDMRPAPRFARLRRDDLILLLNAPGAGGQDAPGASHIRAVGIGFRSRQTIATR